MNQETEVLDNNSETTMPNAGGLEKTRKTKFGDVFTIVLVTGLIVASFFIGKLSTEVKMLKDNPRQDLYGNQQPPEDKLGEVDKPDFDNDHVLGDKSAKFALIEYSDYQCPFCQAFHPTAQKALDEYGGKLVWVFRHFPLEQIHPQAKPTAIASECVAKLAGNEAFWKFSDKMFVNSNSLTDKLRKDTAIELGVNGAQFDSCLTDKATEALVKKDLDSGAKAGIRGTPGNVLMNLETGEVQSLPGAVPFETLKAAIDGMMNK
jgi:protein-disulfide isomerase